MLLLLLSLTSGCAATHHQRLGRSQTGERLRLKAIDESVQADACRRTALELASHEKDEHAIAQFERARELAPSMTGIAHPLAVLYDRQGRMDAAEREYRQAIAETPKNPDLLNDYGYFLYSRGDIPEAEAILRKALKLSPKHPKAALNLGMVLAQRKEFDEAFKQFEAAVGPAAAHHNIGMLLMRDGQESEAVAHFQKAIQRDPSLSQTNEVLAQLEQRHTENHPEIQQASAVIAEPGTASLAD
jgi:Tfp pilus assembly protein PilF